MWPFKKVAAASPTAVVPTPEMVAEAKANPGGWVYQIAGGFGPNDRIPPEFIKGAFKVDEDGNITGEFQPTRNIGASPEPGRVSPDGPQADLRPSPLLKANHACCEPKEAVKVVIQNGADHCLARSEAEAVIRHLPPSWGTAVGTVLLARDDNLRTSIHLKEKTVCLYSPRGPLSPEDKRVAVSLLLQALAEASGCELPSDLELRCHMAIANAPA